MATRRSSKIQLNSAKADNADMDGAEEKINEDVIEPASESSWRIILPQDRVDALSVIVQNIDGLSISDGRLAASPEKADIAKRLIFLATGDKGML